MIRLGTVSLMDYFQNKFLQILYLMMAIEVSSFMMGLSLESH
jgi:hypothetical protein